MGLSNVLTGICCRSRVEGLVATNGEVMKALDVTIVCSVLLCWWSFVVAGG